VIFADYQVSTHVEFRQQKYENTNGKDWAQDATGLRLTSPDQAAAFSDTGGFSFDVKCYRVDEQHWVVRSRCEGTMHNSVVGTVNCTFVLPAASFENITDIGLGFTDEKEHSTAYAVRWL
jgi:hypothetical protein